MKIQTSAVRYLYRRRRGLLQGQVVVVVELVVLVALLRLFYSMLKMLLTLAMPTMQRMMQLW
jgi:hypothetical protein